MPFPQKPERFCRLLLLVCGLGAATPALVAQTLVRAFDRALDGVRDRMFYESADGGIYLELGAQFDFWTYNRDNHGGPTGFWFPAPDRDWDSSPRLTLTLDAFFGDRLYGFLKVRWDDGVHPGVAQFYGDHTETRLDEFFLRYTAGPGFNLQVGQFSPLFGGFLSRQNSWDMALVSYPMAYENVTSISDIFPPGDAARFAARRDLPDQPARKLVWIPVVWAPLYSMGASCFGEWGDWGYALNFMNSAPSSRGIIWNNFDFDQPTWLARLERRFGPELALGGNFSNGPYIRPNEAGRLPAGAGVDDFRQTIWSLDAAWAHHDFQVWAEVLYSIFDIPNVGDDARILSYYLEGRWDFAPKWWLALRWNQELYNRITTGPGVEERWEHPVYRVDSAIGFKFSRHAQLKLQYSYQHQDADFQNGRHLLLTEFTLKL